MLIEDNDMPIQNQRRHSRQCSDLRFKGLSGLRIRRDRPPGASGQPADGSWQEFGYCLLPAVCCLLRRREYQGILESAEFG